MNKNLPGFIGFPDAKTRLVKIPELFFTELLPQIDDLAELKLALHCFWLLNEQEGELRYLRGDDLRADPALLKSLHAEGDLRTALQAVADALQRAVARNLLLRVDVEMKTAGNKAEGAAEGNAERSTVSEDWYLMNTPKGRQLAAMIRQGKLEELRAVVPDEARLKVERPNIFILYEQNIGVLSPLAADQLRDMEKSYPPAWIAEAFDIAVASNKRSLRYIQAVLKRWETEGKDNEDTRRDSEASRKRKYTPDEYSDIIIG
jgi:DnaD/phage-associated family protein